VDVLGFREMVLRLTPEAVAHGFHEVIPDRLDLTVGYGRGERVGPDAPSPILLIPVTNGPTHVHRVSETA
jgi:hypothetical protein